LRPFCRMLRCNFARFAPPVIARSAASAPMGDLLESPADGRRGERIFVVTASSDWLAASPTLDAEHHDRHALRSGPHGPLPAVVPGPQSERRRHTAWRQSPGHLNPGSPRVLIGGRMRLAPEAS
jgi:hypothetical protein